MRIKKLVDEDAAGVGRITKQNTTVDVKPGETQRQAAKFGNKVDKNGRPPELHTKARKNSNTHVLTNLGLAEALQLVEAFDNNYPWRWFDRTERRWAATFKSKDGGMFEVFFLPKSNQSPNWFVNFDRDGSHRRSNRGDQFRVFATILDIIKEFFQQENVESIEFSAYKEYKDNDVASDTQDELDSRAKLYTRMVKKFAGDAGFEFAYETHAGETVFLIRKPRSDMMESPSYPLDNHDNWYGDRQYSQSGGQLVYMTPDQYLSKVRPLTLDPESQENIDILVQHIQDGGRLDPLKIYPDGREDGRHRAHAAKVLGIRKVPVIVWPPKNLDEYIQESLEQKIPLNPKYNQDRGNLGWIVKQIEKTIQELGDDLDVLVKSVNWNQLTTTQDHLSRYGGGDPVFPDIPEDYWDYPVIARVERDFIVIDGNHRLNRDIDNGEPHAEGLVFDIQTQVSEDITTIHRDKDEKFGYDFDRLRPSGQRIGRMKGLDLYLEQDSGSYQLYLFDPQKKRVAGLVKFHSSDPSTHRSSLSKNSIVITMAVVDDQYAGQGLVLAAYRYLIRKGYTLISDDIQTLGGQKIWQRLAKLSDVYVYAVNFLRYGEPEFYDVDPDDITDSGIMIYRHHDDDQRIELANELEKLERRRSKLFHWMEKANDDPNPNSGLDKMYRDVQDRYRMIGQEINAIQKEIAAWDKHIKGNQVRLVATKNVRQTANESITIKKPDPSMTLGIPRKKMPQIATHHYPELIQYLKQHGGDFVQRTVSAKTLKPIQSEFSDEGVRKMMRNKDKKSGTTRDKPLIVSSDNYIIDGHHRWLAAWNLDEQIPIMQIDLPVKRLFKLVKEFRHTTYKDIYESLLTEALADPYQYSIVRNNSQVISADSITDDKSRISARLHVVDDHDLAKIAHYSGFDLLKLDLQEDDIWEFFFKRDGNTELTNQGDQFRVFATVVAMFREMVKLKHPKVVMFSASKRNESGSRRSVLYSRFAKLFASESGYQIKNADLFDENYFILIAPQVKLKEMSILEQACLEGGHNLEDLKEISIIPDFKPDDSKEQRILNGFKAELEQGIYKQISSRNNFKYYISLERKDTSNRMVAITNDHNTLVGIIGFRPLADPKTQMIIHAWTNPQYRGQGIMPDMYSALLNQGFNIRSDYEQTRHGQALWRKLAKKFKVRLYRSNGTSNPDFVKYIENDKDFDQAYQDNYSMIIMAKDQKISEQAELDEIRRIPPIPDNNAQHYMNQNRLKAIKNGLYKKISSKQGFDIYANNELLKFQHDGLILLVSQDMSEIPSLLRVNPLRPGVASVSMAWTDAKHRGKGLSLLLYNAVLELGYHIQADTEQTPGGRGIWKKLTAQHDGYLIRDGKIEKPITSQKDFELAYKSNAAYNYSLLIKSPKRNLNENISVTGTQRHRSEREKRLEPGSDAWFAHWFSLPYLRREDVDKMKTEAIDYINSKRSSNNEKKVDRRRSNRNTRTHERRGTR